MNEWDIILYLYQQRTQFQDDGRFTNNISTGNHDITLDTPFYTQHWPHFHNQSKQSPQECRALLTNSPSITYLQHESAVIKLSSPTGPHTQFSIFGSPYSPAHKLWAFGYEPDAAKALWDGIPMDADVVVTHTPPAGHCDGQVSTDGRAGCEELRRRLWSVRPLLHVCGHIHEGRGVEKVRWRDGIARAPFMEDGVEVWKDPGAGVGNGKQSLVDLTGRGRGRGVGFSTSLETCGGGGGNAGFSGEGKGRLPTERELDGIAKVDSKGARLKNVLDRSYSRAVRDLAQRSSEDRGWDEQDGDIVLEPRISRGEVRQGRRETCIVNAAIMASNWGGAKKFNKPIVVDIDLPVWEE